MTFLEGLIKARFPHASGVYRLAHDDVWRVTVDFDNKELVSRRAMGGESIARYVLDRVTPKEQSRRRRLHWGKKH